MLEVHLVEGDHAPERLTALLERLSAAYAAVLDSPLERVRAFATLHRPELWATGGRAGGPPAPYFTAAVLEGRPVEQRHRLLAALTDVIVAELDVERRLVRGRVVPVHPDDWGIGGVPASAVRRGEITARAAPGG